MAEKEYYPTPEQISEVKARGFLIDKRTKRHFNARVLTVNGKVSAEIMGNVAEASRLFGDGNVALTTRQTFEIQHIAYENIQPFEQFLALHGLETGGTGPKVRPVVSCKGTTCVFGLIDSYSLSEKIHKTFYEGYHTVKLPHKFKIAVGGCPNNCVKPDLNDLGVIGQKKPILNVEKCRACKVCQIEKACPVKAPSFADGKISLDGCNSCGRCDGKCPFGAIEGYETGYKICIGGRWGKKTATGRALDVIFKTEDEVMMVIECAILFFRENGNAGERFADTVSRIGFERVQAELVSGEILNRKEEILAK